MIVGVDPSPANSAALRQWCVDYWEATHPYSMGGAYDPENVFRVNQNIQPA